jgi:hypothetical protein
MVPDFRSAQSELRSDWAFNLTSVEAGIGGVMRRSPRRMDDPDA